MLYSAYKLLLHNFTILKKSKIINNKTIIPEEEIIIYFVRFSWAKIKDKKSMINDKEFIKFYIKVRSTLADGNTVYE